MSPTQSAPSSPPTHPTMETTQQLAARYATLPEDILLIGPTGSGKGHLAEFIHRESRRAGALVRVTGGQLSDTLWATQLFGHLPGAFTDAKTRVRGAFERAAGGTLFLDELHHWSGGVQSGLLQPLESRQYNPLGSEREIVATCRMIFATTSSPDDLVASRKLLPDLRYRLPALVLSLLPLASRRGEILPLLDRFTAEILESFGWERCRFHWAPSAVRSFLLHAWPGNIRELHQVIKRTLAHVGPEPTEAIQANHLSLPLAPRVDLASLLNEGALRQVVQWALRQTNDSRQAAAEILGVHRNTMTRYIARWGGASCSRPVHAPAPRLGTAEIGGGKLSESA